MAELASRARVEITMPKAIPVMPAVSMYQMTRTAHASIQQIPNKSGKPTEVPDERHAEHSKGEDKKEEGLDRAYNQLRRHVSYDDLKWPGTPVLYLVAVVMLLGSAPHASNPHT